MKFNKIEDSYSLLESLEPNDLIPVGAKIEVYYNQDGVDSMSSDGYSYYYIVDKELTLNTLITIIDNTNGFLKISSNQVDIVKHIDEDEDCYENLTSDFNY